MPPEDIPEDREEAYPCDMCQHGEITKNKETGKWECDQCANIH